MVDNMFLVWDLSFQLLKLHEIIKKNLQIIHV